jgi:transcriptional regulator with XRE-family HTH domain
VTSAAAPGPSGAPDEVLDALDDLVIALEENSRRNKEMISRARRIQRLRARGLSYCEIVEGQPRPLIVELLTETFDALRTAGARLRRTEARALHDEGLSMDRIAELFGVTRQRISRLLKARNGASHGPVHEID